MHRLLTGVLLLAVASRSATGQSTGITAPEQKASAAQNAVENLSKPEVLRLIALNEAETRDGEKNHADRKQLILFYSNLGILYEDADMCFKAEDAMRRAIALLRDGPQDQLAAEIGQLAVLHVSMGMTRQAEKDEIQALQIRQAVGDPVGIALAERDLAGLYAGQRKFTKALDYAPKAFAILANRQDVSVVDRIAVRQTLGFALTGIRNCGPGIQALKDAFELAKSSTEENSQSVGYSEFLLGFGYWQCGDREHAAVWLQRGTTDMKGGFGWGQDMYVNAMKSYVRFLRESGQQEAAVSAEAVVHQAESVVDASALAGRTEGFRSAGSK
jgi:tetratricopeptide (TPR) repeat protein